MTAYTKNTPGAPTGGLYALGDTVLDSVGTNHVCVLAGPISANPLYPSFVAEPAFDLTTTKIGTPGTGVTAVEYGDGYNHVTVLTLGAAAVLPAVVGSLGVGLVVYTFPAGDQILMASNINVGITQTGGLINANTPTVGLGSVVASGAVVVLSGTATFQDINVGVAAANCTGTKTIQSKLATSSPFAFLTAAAGSKVVNFNAAVAWAGADAGPLLSGTITLVWKTLM